MITIRHYRPHLASNHIPGVWRMERFALPLLILLTLSAPSLAGAQEMVTDPTGVDSGVPVAVFLNAALANNPGLEAARARHESALARIPQARAWDDPQVGVEFYSTPITSANPFKDGMETDYFVQQMIPFWGKKGLMGRAASSSAQIVEQAATTTVRDLIVQVKRAYAMLYSAQRRLGVNETNQRLLRQIIESARAKYSAGTTTQGDVLKVQVEMAQLQNERSVLEQELSSAIAMMNALRSVETTIPIDWVSDITPDSLQVTLDALNAISMENRPELRGMQFEIDMNRFEHAAARRERFPDFMIRGMYKDMTEGTDQWAGMVGINIPFSPFGIGKYSGRITETKANVISAERTYSDMQNMVRFQVRDAWTKVQSRWQQIDRYQRTILPQAEEALQSTLASYQTDRVDFLSLLDSYRTLQMFRMEYFMAVAEHYSSLAELERAVGSDLE